MRTTLDLPEELIEEAMTVTKLPTKTAVITTALERLIQQSKISGIKKYFGKVNLDIDLDKLRGRDRCSRL
jgi:Arc/MetJ family transcription regulator